MYFNYEYIKSQGATLGDILVLQLVKQLKTDPNVVDPLSKTIKNTDEYLLSRESFGWFTEIKGKKSDPRIAKLRLTDKGLSLLEKSEIPFINNQDEVLYEWVKKMYVKRDKEIGNQKKGLMNMALFRVHSNISGNKLAFLLKNFLEDDSAQNFSLRVDYIFFKATNVFQTKFDLGDSKLWSFYQKRKSFFEEEFKKMDNYGG